MANLAKTRTIFGFTSPRSVEKIIPEIRLLTDTFGGKVWNSALQADFFRTLFESDFYQGNKMPQNITLAGRDRITRAPKALGFVDLKPIVQLTAAGRELLSGKRTHEVLARQLFKFQLPSPYHPLPIDRNFNVRPYLELLRLIREVGSVSKTEIAIFFLALTNYSRFTDVVSSIQKFRLQLSANKSNRKVFIDTVFTQEILRIYNPEISGHALKTRESSDESLDKFVRTKKSNHIDYADALIRYLRATQLVSFEKKTFRLVIPESRAEEVNYILQSTERSALEFRNEAEYKEYLFNPGNLKFLTDNRSYLEKRLGMLGVLYNRSLDISSLKDLLDDAEKELSAKTVQAIESSLKYYQEFDDIIEVFGQITKKLMPDPSLYLEWNVWRSLVMINYAQNVQGNFALDIDGIPLSTAAGNRPDIEGEYTGFKVITEVTMSSGYTQYNMENESVPRHYGSVLKHSNVPVYCLFIAPKISEGTLAYFFNLNKSNTRLYGGKTKIIPLNLQQFIQFITIAKERSFNNPHSFRSYLDSIIDYNMSADDEIVWAKYIEDTLPTWVPKRV